MVAHDKSEPVYMIGVVAALTQMHAQTIRLYERLGLVNPQRKNKNRLYSEADVERLRQIRRLTQEMGVNLAGVEVILDLLNKMEQLQSERDQLLNRSVEIEIRVREYLQQTGGKFPWLEQLGPLPPGQPMPDLLPTPPPGSGMKQISAPPIILPPPPRQLSPGQPAGKQKRTRSKKWALLLRTSP